MMSFPKQQLTQQSAADQGYAWAFVANKINVRPVSLRNDTSSYRKMKLAVLLLLVMCVALQNGSGQDENMFPLGMFINLWHGHRYVATAVATKL